MFRAVNFKTKAFYPSYDLVVPTVDGGISAIYQTAKKQMQEIPENYDATDKWLLDTLEGMLTKTYTEAKPREEQFYYTADDMKDICFIADQLKMRVGPFPGDTLSLNTDNLTLKQNGTAKLSAAIGEDTVNDKHLIWSSSDDSVVKVVDGKLTAVSSGEATVTVTSAYNSSVKAVCSVKVTDTASDPTDSGETDTEAPPPGNKEIPKDAWIKIIIGVSVGVVAVGAIVVCVCIAVKKKKK